MKTGLTLEQLAAEITRQQSAKEDYVVNTGNLRLESYGPDLTLRVLDSDGADRIEPLEIGDIAHRQIGTHLSIPAKYYERMRSEDPGLLAHNVNTWLERTPAQRMIRVLDGKARAYPAATPSITMIRTARRHERLTRGTVNRSRPIVVGTRCLPIHICRRKSPYLVSDSAHRTSTMQIFCVISSPRQ